MTELTGKTLADRYRAAELVARGCCGSEVYRGEDIRTGRRVTLKVLPASILPGEDTAELLRKDAAEAARTDPGGVIGFIELVRAGDGTCVFVADVPEGETLARILDREVNISYDRALHMALSLCKTLDRLHGAGLIHGDLKPENILLQASGEARPALRILDFGMAHLWKALLKDGKSFFAPFYLAPEQVKGGSVDPRTDIYALGIILYQAMVGRVPFDGESFEDVTTKIVVEQAQQPRTINATIPKEVNSLIMCAMDPDPDSRFQSASEFAVIIENVMEVVESIKKGDIEEESTFGSETTGLYIRPGEAPVTPLQKLMVEMGMQTDTPEEWARVIGVLENLMAASQDPAEKMRAGKSLALIYDNKLFNTEKSRDVYTRILEIDPANDDALEELERIYSLDLNWPALIGILRRKLERQAEPREKIDILMRIGEVFFAEISDLPSAAQAYREIVDGLDPTHQDSLETLKTIYLQMGSWEEYIEILSRLIPGAPPHVKVHHYEEIATTWFERLGRPSEAGQACIAILKIQPDHAVASSLLQQIGGSPPAPAGLEEEPTPALQPSLKDDIEEEEERDFMKPPPVPRQWRPAEVKPYGGIALPPAMSQEPEGPTAAQPSPAAAPMPAGPPPEDEAGVQPPLPATKPAPPSQDTVPDYVMAYPPAPAAAPQAHEDVPTEPVPVAEAPQPPPAPDPIPSAVPAIAIRQIPPPPPPSRKILPSQPPPAPAEAMLPPRPEAHAAVPSPGVAMPQPPLPTADIDWIKDVEDPSALVQELLDAYEAEKDKRKRSELLLKTAQLYEVALWDEDAAFLLFQKAYLEHFSDPLVVQELERITAKNGKWDELIAVVNEKITELGNRIEAVPLYLHAGKWYVERLSHLEYALAIYSKALQLDPQNLDVLGAIADLYKLAGQWESYLHYLKMQVEKAKTDEQRREVLLKLGRTYHQDLNRTEHAIETFRKVLQLDPANEESLTFLEDIYRNWGLSKELAEILERRLQKLGPEGDVEKVKALCLSLGQIYENQLQDALAAVKVYQRVVELDDTDMKALRGLERLFTSMDQARDLLDVLEMEFKASPIDKEKVEFLTRIAEMYERSFLKPDVAREKYEQVLFMDPDNLTALENLERLLRTTKSWVSLVEMLQRHALAVPDDASKVMLLLGAGQILMDELRNVQKAVEVYRAAADIDPLNVEALKRLAALHGELEEHEESAKVLQRLANIFEDTPEKAETLYRLGVLLSGKLNRKEEAVQAFHRVLAILPDHLDTLGALRTLYFESQQYDMAAKIIDVEQKFTTDAMQKSELLYARGRILLDYQARPDEAMEFFRQAMEAWPDNDEAARPLADLYISHQRWEDALPLLETIVRWGGRKDDKQELIPYYLNLAGINIMLGSDSAAADAYRGALAIDPDNVPAVKGLAETLYRLTEWAEAYTHFSSIIKNHPDTQTKKEKIEIYHRLGEIKLKLGEPRKALKLFEAILEIDSHHRQTLEALITIFTQYEDHEQVIYFKKLLSEVLEGDEKVNVLVEIGDIWQEKLFNSIKAIGMYSDALKLQPSNRTLLFKLSSLYSDTKQWPKAIEVLKAIAGFEEDPQRKSRYFNSIAVIYQSEVKDFDQAVDYFNKALDADPDNLKNFEAIEMLLTPLRDWKKLEKNYRDMLFRIKGRNNVLEENLLHNLGEIYRTRLKHYEAAVEVFKMAVELAPDNLQRHEILAELFTILPDRLAEAAREYQILLQKEAERTEWYKALRSIYHTTGQWDKLYCVCAALSVMNQADQEERNLYEYYRMNEYRMPQAPLDNEAWLKYLFHPSEDVFIGKMFEVVMPVIFKRKVQSLKVYNLKKKDRRDPAAGPEPAVRMFGMLGRALGLLLPEIHVSAEQAMPLQYAITDPPASVIGRPLAMGNADPRDLAFLMTKHLVYYRGDHYIRLLEPTVSGLSTLLLACIKTVETSFGLAPDMEAQVIPVAKVIRKELQPVQLEQLGRFVRAFLGTNVAADLKKWTNCVELTACRAGLLLCNDLETAVRAVGAEPGGLSELSPKEKIKELILFSVSDRYFRLREIVGYNLQPAPQT